MQSRDVKRGVEKKRKRRGEREEEKEKRRKRRGERGAFRPCAVDLQWEIKRSPS